MRIYLELGLYDAIRQEAAKHYDEHAGLYDVEWLAGRFLGPYTTNPNEDIESVSPTMHLCLTQQKFEPILRKKVVEEGGDLCFSSELIDFQQDADGQGAWLQPTVIGIGIDGRGLLSHSITIYFYKDAGKHVKGKYSGVIYVNADTVRGLFRIDKSGREGFLGVNTAGERGTEESRYPANKLTNERAQEILRAAVGADIEIQATLILPWRAFCDNARRYSQGRVLLVGETAATVRKQLTNVFERYISRTAPELKNTGIEVKEEVPEPHMELGNRYNCGAVDVVLQTAITDDPASAISSPGSIARHAVVDNPGHADNIPLADLLGHTFVLLTGQQGASAATGFQSEILLPEF
ncbi:MAG: hypothetical protein Q9175_006543 [Cornicularia normoerica]